MSVTLAHAPQLYFPRFGAGLQRARWVTLHQERAGRRDHFGMDGWSSAVTVPC